jgi:hypothetical protein
MAHQFILLIGIVQSILFLGHWFLYRTLVRFFGPVNPAIALTLKVALGLLSVSLLLTSFLTFRYYNLLVRFLYTAAASWLGISYLFILAAILAWILYGSAKLFHFPLDCKILIEILMGIALMASLYGFINSRVIRTHRMSLQLPDLPSQWKGKTAVWVSDTHLGQVRNYGFARHIATMVQNLHPDLSPESLLLTALILLPEIMKNFLIIPTTSGPCDVRAFGFYITKWLTWMAFRSLAWIIVIQEIKSGLRGFCKRWGSSAVGPVFC